MIFVCVSLDFEGRPRNEQTIEATAGAVTDGEATFEGKGTPTLKKIKVYEQWGTHLKEYHFLSEDEDCGKSIIHLTL